MKSSPFPLRFLSFLVLLLSLQATLAHATDSKPIHLPKLSPATPQGMEGGYWKTDHDFNPILRLKNVLLTQPISVTPILYFADGTPFTLPVITLEPAGVAQVNIRIALQSVPAKLLSHISTYGMAGISYQWSWPAVIATIQNTDEIASLTITNSLRADVRHVHAAPEVDATQVTRGQWWLPTANADGYIVLENASMTPKQATIQFSGHTGSVLAKQQVQLPSHATNVVRLSSALSAARGAETVGGIEIHYTGPDHGVVAYAGVEDESLGYSTSPILIEDHLDPARPAHQVTLSAPGLLLGKADPEMLFPSDTYFKPYAYFHNVSANPLQVSLSLVSPGSGDTPQTRSLGEVTLQPGETSQFDFDSQFTSANPLPDGYGHLTASFQGHDGDLQMSTGSTDQSMSYVFEVIPSQQADSASRSLCFWSAEGDNDTMITVWNYKTTAQDLVLTLYYSGGHYTIPIHLAARQSYNLDMMSLIRSRVPDPSGTLIPSNITSGSGILSGAGGETDKISVAVAASIFNVRNATCGNICNTCNGLANEFFGEATYTVVIQGNVAATFTEVMNTGTTITNNSSGVWSSNNTAVATVNSSGVITGQSAGTTPIVFTLMNVPIDAGTICAGELVPCPSEGFAGNVPATTPPKVTFSPLTGVPVGGTMPVIITFSGAATTSPVPITISLATTPGTGAAGFSGGGSTMTITTAPTTVNITGITASSTANNITLDATIPGAEPSSPAQEDATAPLAFSVVSVALSLQTTGKNAVPNVNFPFPSMGTQIINGFPPGYTSCLGAFQVTGQITPSNYSGPVYLRKTLTGNEQWEDPGANLLRSLPSQDDTSDPDLESAHGPGNDRRASDQSNRRTHALEHRRVPSNRLFPSSLDTLLRCPLKNKRTPVGHSPPVKMGTPNAYAASM